LGELPSLPPAQRFPQDQQAATLASLKPSSAMAADVAVLQNFQRDKELLMDQSKLCGSIGWCRMAANSLG